jgi:hypothetical protein
MKGRVLLKAWKLLISINVLLSGAAQSAPDIGDPWKEKFADCIVIGQQKGAVVTVSTTCKESSDLGMVAGFALAKRGYGFCGSAGNVEFVKGHWMGIHTVLVGKCTK